MYCTNCGTEIRKSHEYCVECGTTNTEYAPAEIDYVLTNKSGSKFVVFQKALQLFSNK